MRERIPPAVLPAYPFQQIGNQFLGGPVAPDFAKRIRALRPEIRVFGISGTALPATVRELFDWVLPKPLTLAELRRAMGTGEG